MVGEARGIGRALIRKIGGCLLFVFDLDINVAGTCVPLDFNASFGSVDVENLLLFFAAGNNGECCGRYTDGCKVTT